MTDSVLKSVASVNAFVTGRPSGASSDGASSDGGPCGDPLRQAKGLAVQSVAQTAAMIVQDAGNLFRNLSTIETTAIGIATAKWIEDPENVAYAAIIENSQQVIQAAALLIEKAGASAKSVLQAFGDGGGS